jgi:predicted negative regulator of RcsB-dependent stress response
MLKPKKKITKKEIKKDPFLETLYNIRQNFEKNRKLYTQGLIGIVAVIVVVFFLNNRIKSITTDSTTLLGQAMVSYEIGDIENALFQFEQLTDVYGKYKNGKVAYYYLGKIYFDRSEVDLAEQYLTDFVERSDHPILLNPAYVMLADIAVKNEESAKGVAHLRQAVKHSSHNEVLFHSQLRLAELLIDNNNEAEAAELVSEILDSDNLPYKIKQYAEEISGRLID